MPSIKALFLPVARALEDVCSVVLLLAGFNVCFAIATFVAYGVVGDAELGRMWFLRVMQFRDAALSDTVREFAEALNWCALGTIAIFVALSSVTLIIQHLDEVRRQSLRGRGNASPR